MQENMQVMVNVTIMHTRRTILWTMGAGLWTLAGGRTWAQTVASIPPSMDVVTQFVAARAAQDYAKAYALLSADTQKQIPYTRFINTGFFRATVPSAAEHKTQPEELAFYVLFMDTHNTMNYTFEVIGANPNTVFVSAQPPVKSPASDTNPVFLQVVTVPNPQSVPRIDILKSYAQTGPAANDKVREQARLAASLVNLKKIGLFFIQYDSDHKRLPDAAEWMDAIMLPTLDSTTINTLRDQSAPKGQQFSYAFNKNLSCVSLDSLTNPSDTVLAFTSTLGTKNAADTGKSLPKPGWHTGGSVVVFCNGLARWVKDGTPLRFTP